MYQPGDDRFWAEVSRSGHMAIGGIDLELADGSRRALQVVDGSVPEDASASVRRRLTATVLDDGLTPLDATSPLFPGAVLRPWRGVQYRDGSQTRIPLGVMLSGEPVADLDRGTISIDGDDRSGAVALAPLVSPWPIAEGSSLLAVVSALLQDRLPGCPDVQLYGSDRTLAETFIPAQVDPWAALVSDSTDTPGLVTSAGMRLWFDADGIPTLVQLAPTAQPVTLDGAALVLTARAGIDPRDTYGGVCVTSNVFGDDDPLTSVLVDPTPVSDMFAKRYYFQAMDDLDNQDDLDAAAQQLFASKTGIVGTASWTMPPNPALQAGDLVTMGDGLLAGSFELRVVTTPLLTGSQSIDTVERVLA